MLHGSIVAIVTPFDSENNVDYNELKRLCHFHIENGTDGILALGTTGEASLLSLEEKRKIVELIINECGLYLDICVGIIGNTLDKVIEEYNNISDLEFDSYLVINPYYIRSNEAGLIKYFTYIADKVNKPVIIYNVPKRTGESISLNVVRTLSYHKNIVGIKNADSSSTYQVELLKLQKDDFKLYCGDDFLILSSLGLGYDGLISVISNAFPKEIKLIVNKYNDNKEDSILLYFSLLDIIKSIYIENSPIGIKYLMYLLGFKTTNYRLPLVPPSNKVKRIIECEILKFTE